jgi:hypothetical protein
MPTLDDQYLDTLLHEAGDSFAVPPAGASAILGRIHRDDDEKAGRGAAVTDSGESPAPPTASTAPAPVRRIGRTITRTVRAHRVLTVAAAVLILLLAAAGAVRLGSGPSKTNQFGTNAAPATSSPQPRSGFGHTSAGSTSARSTSARSTSAGSTSAGAPAVESAPASASTSPASKSALSQNPAALGTGAVGQPARIEQTGSLDLRVGRGALSATIDRLDALAGTGGGFVANSQTNSGSAGGVPSGTVTLEVPVASFSTVLREAQSLGTVSNLTTQATDVTAQYADLQSQITALEASRQQYLTIMTKTASIGDVLAVQGQLNTLQSQIQQLQGQLTVLGSETDYSKITTVVSEPGPSHHHPAAAAPSGLARAWHGSVHGFVAGAEGLIRIAGPALFALLCLAATLLGGQLFWRRLQRHNL